MALKIRSKDEVIVLTGKYKGKIGKIKKIIGKKVFLDGVCLVKKHQKPLPSLNRPGGIIEKESAIDISNLAFFNTKTNKPDKIGFKIQNEKKVRFLKKTGEVIK